MKNFNCKIKCPVSFCSKYLSDPDIRKFLSITDEERYEKLGMKSIYKNCLSKNCTYIYDISAIDMNFPCPECEQPNCVKCEARHLRSFCGKQDVKSENERDNEVRMTLQKKRMDKLQNYDNVIDLIPSHIEFDCPICCEFILPKNGVMLRCGCYHCKSCLFDAYQEMHYFNQLKCHTCNVEFAAIEKLKITSEDKLKKINLVAMKPLLFKCQGPDCEYLWHTEKTSGFLVCPNCNNVNCFSCNDIHEGMTCEQFRRTDLYNLREKLKSKSEKLASVKCYRCSTNLIISKGCGAMKCPNCNDYTCLFTGLKVGPEGCRCTPAKPCHENCKYGCLTETN